jgi:hypothetical protein
MWKPAAWEVILAKSVAMTNSGYALAVLVYRSWEWVCYLPVICPADSAPSMFPPSHTCCISFLNLKFEQAVTEYE